MVGRVATKYLVSFQIRSEHPADKLGPYVNIHMELIFALTFIAYSFFYISCAIFLAIERTHQ